MSNLVSFEDLSALSTLLTERTGLHFSEDRFSNFEKMIKPAALDLGFKNIESCIKWILSSKITAAQFKILIRHLTIGETYFFRDKNIFEALEYKILPELISRKRQDGRNLKIWSAACSTGEEAYSLAILLKRVIPDPGKWNLTILASDINRESLKKASKGLYGNWSFRNAPPWLKNRYFVQNENQYEIIPEIKKMVTFSYLNLSENVYPLPGNNTKSLDMVLCRNVLMYFSPDYMKMVIDRLYHSLADKAWLIVSPGETSTRLFEQFNTVYFKNAILYQKDIENKEKNGNKYSADLFENRHSLDFKKISKPENPVPGKEESGKIIDLEKTDLSILIENARSLYKKGFYSKALENLIEINSVYPRDIEVISFIAEIHANQGRFEKALDWCRKGLNIDKLNLNLCFLCASIYQETGNIKQAVNYLNKTLYINPGFVSAHFSLGLLYFNKGSLKDQTGLKDSIRCFKNTLSLLKSFTDEDEVPGTKGLTAGELKQAARQFMEKTKYKRELDERSV